MTDIERSSVERALTEPEKAAFWFERARQHSERADAAEAEIERLRVLVARLALKDPYNEDGYCLWCGNGDWKHHGPDCAWADAKE